MRLLTTAFAPTAANSTTTTTKDTRSDPPIRRRVLPRTRSVGIRRPAEQPQNEHMHGECVILGLINAHHEVVFFFF